VVEGGPAAAAGVRSGDILLELDGRRIEQSTNLLYLAALVGPAKKVSLRLLRDGQQRSIVLTTAELPE
jgi:S1-C subfamily serine protease